MMARSAERGAVHIMFLIVVLVIGLAFGGLWFTQFQENEDLRNKASTADRKYTAAVEDISYMNAWYGEIARVVGQLPAEIPLPTLRDDVNVNHARNTAREAYGDDLRSLMDSIAGRIEDPAAKPDQLVKLAEAPIRALTSAKSEIEAQKATIASLQSQIESLNNQLSEQRSEFESSTSALKDQHSTEAEGLRNENNDLSGRVDSLTERLTEADNLRESEVSKAKDSERDLRTKTREFEGQVNAVRGERKIARQQAKVDGSIVSVDPITRTAFLDLTSKDLLHAGLRFQVFGLDKAGERFPKGFITVTKVSTVLSEAKIDSEVAGAGGIGGGDQIVSPVFDKGQPVRFTFLGVLDGSVTNAVAKTVLERSGAKVDDAVTVNTDFIVVGINESEDDLPIRETEPYRDAQRWGIPALRARDLEPFLQR